MTYVSIFSGIEAASVAWRPLGWRALAFAEIEPFPSAVLAERFPDVPNLGDVSQVDWSPYRGRTDVLVGGSPCFVAGTPVTTARGVIPIEDVVVGDLVLTHVGRWRKVLATGSDVSDTVVLRGQGTAAIECTPGHPFWAREKRGRSTRVDGRSVHVVDIGDPEWVRADGLDHLFWFCPSEIEPLPVPGFDASDFTYQTTGEGHLRGFEFSEAFFHFVGMWLGDGWANTHRRRERRDSVMKRVYICCAKGKESEMASTLDATGLHWGMSESRATYRFTCSSNQLYDWLVGNFGVHADGKTLPGWVFGMRTEWRRALYEGYLSTDGHRSGRDMRSVSVSRCLTVGMKTLAATLGFTSSVVRTEPRQGTEIEGREVNERPYYTQTYCDHGRSAFFMDGGWWGLVRRVLPGSQGATVYNLEVEGDNSYAADGIAVHNCQSFSVAGKRGGLDDPRGRLMLEFVRAVQDVGPRWVVWENVPGVLSQDEGRAFGTLLNLLDECGYGLAWRVLDAQFFGVAQRRRRVFLVGGPTAGCACAVLFEPGSLPGGPGESKAAREALAGAARERAGGEGEGCLTPGEHQSQRIYGTDGTSPTLQSRPDGTGTNTPTVAFKHFMGAKAGNIGYGVDVSPTLTDSSAHQPAVAFPWAQGVGFGANPSEELSPTIGAHPYNSPAVAIQSTSIGRNPDAGPQSKGWQEDVCYTLDTREPHAVAFAQNTRDEVRLVNGDGQIAGALAARPGAKQQTYVCMTDTQSNSSVDGDVCGTVTSHAHKDPPVVSYAVRERAGKPGGGKGPLVSDEVSLTIATFADQTVFRGEGDDWVVRRLTPLECERLQGFPDNWTAIDGAKDGPRYKAIGNSMAVPVMRWIGERIEEVERVMPHA